MKKYVEDYVVIPIVDLDNKYFIDTDGTIIKNEDNTLYTIYKWDKNTALKPIKIILKNGNDVYLEPAKLYMLTFYGYCDTDIVINTFPQCNYYDIQNIYHKDSSIYINDLEFKAIPSCDQLYVNEYGCVYNDKTKSISKQTIKSKKDYHKTVNGVNLHRLVYEAWCGELIDGYEIHHKDFNPWNNHYTNLEQLTKNDHILIHGKNVYTDKLVHKLCKYMQDGLFPYEAARLVGVPRQYAVDVKLGLKRKNISSQYDFGNLNKADIVRKFNKDQINEICKLFQEYELSNKEIGELFGVNQYTIQDIRNRRTYKEMTKEFEFRSDDPKSNHRIINSIRNATISEDIVVKIWRELQLGNREIDVSRKFNVSRSIVNKIKNRYRWTRITDNLGPLPSDL